MLFRLVVYLCNCRVVVYLLCSCVFVSLLCICVTVVVYSCSCCVVACQCEINPVWLWAAGCFSDEVKTFTNIYFLFGKSLISGGLSCCHSHCCCLFLLTNSSWVLLLLNDWSAPWWTDVDKGKDKQTELCLVINMEIISFSVSDRKS